MVGSSGGASLPSSTHSAWSPCETPPDDDLFEVFVAGRQVVRSRPAWATGRSPEIPARRAGRATSAGGGQRRGAEAALAQAVHGDAHGVGDAHLAAARAHEFAPFAVTHAIEVVYGALAERAVLGGARGNCLPAMGHGDSTTGTRAMVHLELATCATRYAGAPGPARTAGRHLCRGAADSRQHYAPASRARPDNKSGLSSQTCEFARQVRRNARPPIADAVRLLTCSCIRQRSRDDPPGSQTGLR